VWKNYAILNNNLWIDDMENELYEKYKGLSQDDLDEEFIQACKLGDLNAVTYLLTSKELPINADISAQRNQGIISACLYDQLEIIRFLLTSPLLSEHSDVHVNNEIVFKSACIQGRDSIVAFLINEMQIPQNDEINDYFKTWPHPYAEKLFLQRDLHIELPISKESSKKSPKI
jgi:ankyrin repeat protein